MKQLFYLILILLPATAFPQANLHKVLQKIEKSSDIGMSVTNVIKRNPKNRKVEMKVFTVDNIQPKYVREIAKALDKDADDATYYRSESANGTVVRVAQFTSNKSDLNVILTYGPGSRSLVVREDFTVTKKTKKQQRSRSKSKNTKEYFDFGGINGMKSLEDLKNLQNLQSLQDLKNLQNLQESKNHKVVKKKVITPGVTVYKYNYDYNGSSERVVEITKQDGVTHIYVNSI